MFFFFQTFAPILNLPIRGQVDLCCCRILCGYYVVTQTVCSLISSAPHLKRIESSLLWAAVYKGPPAPPNFIWSIKQTWNCWEAKLAQTPTISERFKWSSFNQPPIHMAKLCNLEYQFCFVYNWEQKEC